MSNLSEDYYLRELYFRLEEVPTLSVMKEKMTPALAAVYFKSMRPRLKQLAGLEPSLRGGGTDWYVPPDELLKGRAVLKPVKKEVLAKLNHEGIATIGTAVFQRHRKAMDLQIEQALSESDNDWKNTVTTTTLELWNDLVAAATKNNTKHITNDFDDFANLYRQSIGKIEILFHESAVAEIKNTRENAIQEMKTKYESALKYQASLIYDDYNQKLMEEKTRLKIDFMQTLEISRTEMADRLHDLKVDKHMAVEKLKQCLHCRNLACGVYVALKEREECLKETEKLKHRHMQKVKIMTDTILVKDFEIRLAEGKEKKRRDFCNIWRKKLCHVVKSFQNFVSYCLNMLPEHAEFFINMEKLMLLQVNEVLEDPSAPSIIELEQEQFHAPVPRPKPFYLFCDTGYKPKLEEDLCPRHSGTSSASGLPVIIINKRCLYAACDNFEQFTNKIKEFIHGHRGDDDDFKDDLIYEHFVPVKYGSSQQLLQMKLESSLLQIVQQEIAYVEADKNIVPINCDYCQLPWCSCPPRPTLLYDGKEIKLAPSSTPSSRHKLQTISSRMEWDHEREPKWDSFCKHVQPKKCSCAKTAKKHLAEHLPIYMRHMRYGPPEIPGYKMCSTKDLKNLVKKARKEIYSPPVPLAVPSRTKNVSTQCCDTEFDNLCTCLSDPDVVSFLLHPTMLDLTGTDAGKGAFSSQLKKPLSSFATSRAHSLRNLLKEYPDIEEIFTRKDCAI